MEAQMEVIVTREGPTMNIARPALAAVPFLTFVKGVGGCAFVALCFGGAGAAIAKLPFGPTAQLLATAIGAGIGGILAWYTGNPSAER
jgi:hypothetical protein